MKAVRVAALTIAATAIAACSAGDSLALSASAPFTYPMQGEPSIERVAIVVTIGNKSDDDLVVNLTDFMARDHAARIYAANAAATAADARLVRLAGGQRGMSGLLPLPPASTLRKNDVLSGFVVFDVPAGVRPTQLVFRQTDTDHVVNLAAEP